ncbi:MAG: HpcH/HpaI aldolase/citrate lyase family protein [Terracidiphilus sp.]
MTETAGSFTQEIPPRSYLFVPGDRPERYPKALASGADAVILDLEDAVSPARKAVAREYAAEWLSSGTPVYLRVNGPETEWFRDDLELCRMPGVLGIVLPKAQDPSELEPLYESGQGRPLLAMIESARGFAQAQTIVREPGVRRLIFGTYDFRFDLGLEGDGEELLYFRSHLVLVSRLAGLPPPVDGVTTEIKDTARVRSDARASRRLGFGAKLCIHPNQIAVVNESFGPSAEEVAWAERVMEAWHGVAGGAVALDGKMVDRPIALKAEAILRASRRG